MNWKQGCTLLKMNMMNVLYSPIKKEKKKKKNGNTISIVYKPYLFVQQCEYCSNAYQI